MSVKAPFRFSRINKWVYEPDWADLASHDIPFIDGLSGTATITLKAITPLLIGSARTTNNGVGAVYPFTFANEYAIPESTLQGMCRSILEIAGFGRLGPGIEDRRFGIRDLSGTKTAQEHYQRRLATKSGRLVTQHSQPGWLIRNGNEIRIVPCKMARIHVDEVYRFQNDKRVAAGLPKEPRNRFHERSDAKVRYDAFLAGLGGRNELQGEFDIGSLNCYDHAKKKWDRSNRMWIDNENWIQIEYHRCIRATSSRGTDGTLVLTGKTQRGVDYTAKKYEFVFHDPARSAVSFAGTGGLEVSEQVWDAFQFLHEGQTGRNPNPNWDFWKPDFEAGQPIPVFYWTKKDNNGNEIKDASGNLILDTFGTAFAFKAAHELSTHGMLDNSTPKHTEDIETAALDLPGLIFGIAAEGNQGRGLKRRAWFGLGRHVSGDEAFCLGNAVLLGPKPNYAGLYVRQKDGATTINAGNEAFASYSPIDKVGSPPHLKKPQLAGVKIWPASYPQPANVNLPHIPHNIAQNPSVITELNPLPHGTRFDIPLTFHNLRPMELGALLWALSYGESAAFAGDINAVKRHHRIGMGKPYGLGEVALATDLRVDDANGTNADTCLKAFVEHMTEVYPHPDGWENSRQVQALLEASDPRQNETADLRYMLLQPADRRDDPIGTYVGGKKDRRGLGHFLGDYAPDGNEVEPEPEAEPEPEPEPAAVQVIIAETEPVVGARVLIRADANRKIAGKWGTIIKILKAGDYGTCQVRIDNLRPDQTISRRLFERIIPPE